MVKSKNGQRNYSEKTLKILYGNAAGRCSKCKCELVLTDADGQCKQIGEIAHIYPFGKSTAPRYDEISQDNFDEKYKNEYINLILLCPKCHTKIDELPKIFTAKKIIKMKEDHENWVLDNLSEKISNITYAELDVICKAIASSPSHYNCDSDYSTISIEQKIEKNGLSDNIYNLIMIGMLKTKYVYDYLNNQFSPTFSENLIKCIKCIYLEEAQKNTGDDLFLAVLERMNAGIEQDITKQAAGIAVLTYFFHICEVFEK